MLEALTPKITDISSIKGISTLLALPMLCIAYFLQTGSNISFGNFMVLDLDQGLSEHIQLKQLIFIFVLKSIWISSFGLLAYGLLSYIYVNFTYPVIELTSVLMIAFALFGIFCSSQFIQLKLIEPFWFYGFIVWGVFLQAMKEQLDAARIRIEQNFEDNKKNKSSPVNNN